MTKYREIIRLAQPELKLSQQKIALSCGVSKKTVSKVLKAANEKNVSWPLPALIRTLSLKGSCSLEKRNRPMPLRGACRIMSMFVKNCAKTA